MFYMHWENFMYFFYKAESASYMKYEGKQRIVQKDNMT
jgi:hypothetical protein